MVCYTDDSSHKSNETTRSDLYVISMELERSFDLEDYITVFQSNVFVTLQCTLLNELRRSRISEVLICFVSQVPLQTLWLEVNLNFM